MILISRLARSFAAAMLGSVLGALIALVIILVHILDHGTNEEVAFFFITSIFYLGELAPYGMAFVVALTAALAVTDEPLLRAFFVGFATLMLLLLAEAAVFSDFLAKFFAVANLRWVGAASAGVAWLLAMLFSRRRRPAESGREG